MTLWSPDTCGCSIEYSDDGNFTQGTIHKTCTKHAGVPPANLLTTIFAHNRGKNNVLNWLMSTFDLTPDPVTGDFLFAVNYDFNAPMANDPVLVAGIGAALAAKASPVSVATVRANAATKFGAGAVTIVS